MIRDQKNLPAHLVGLPPIATVRDVMAFYTAYGLQQGWVVNGVRTPGGTIADHTGTTVLAYVNHSRWLADCPNCAGGTVCWPDHTFTVCTDCGRKYTVAFPAPADVASGESVIEARPEEGNRNWECHRGETVADLKVENVRRGLPPTNTPRIRGRGR